jgi:ankyrin repeat protein
LTDLILKQTGVTWIERWIILPLPGANVDVSDADGSTALHMALTAGKPDVLDELLAAMRKNSETHSNTRPTPSDGDVIPGRCQHASLYYSITVIDRLALQPLFFLKYTYPVNLLSFILSMKTSCYAFSTIFLIMVPEGK